MKVKSEGRGESPVEALLARLTAQGRPEFATLRTALGAPQGEGRAAEPVLALGSGAGGQDGDGRQGGADEERVKHCVPRGSGGGVRENPKADGLWTG